MLLRELTDGEAQACREKAQRHILRLQESFTPQTTDEEKFIAYQDLFKRAAYGVSRCSENFEGDNYQRWLQDKNTATALRKSNAEGVIMLEMIREEMEKLNSSEDHQPLTRVNGTSVKFAECANICIKVREDFSKTDRVYREKIMGEPCTESVRFPILETLEVKMMALVTALLFIPDSLVA